MNSWVKSTKRFAQLLNSIEQFPILASTITGCVSISAYAFLVDIPTGITHSAIGLKICAVTAGIKKYTSIIRKKKKKQDKIVLLAESKLNSIEVFISKALIINNVLKEYNEIKEEIKNLKTQSNLSNILVYLQSNVIVLFEV